MKRGEIYVKVYTMKLFGLFSGKDKDAYAEGLERSQRGLFDRVKRAVLGRSEIDDDVLDDVEEALISSDVGVDTSLKIIDRLRDRAARDKYASTNELWGMLRSVASELFTEADNDCPYPLFDRAKTAAGADRRPYVILVVGVNGVGKTTTIAKLGWRLKQMGLKVMFGAADTFRAAAVEQLKVWGERVGVPVVSQRMGADPASVAYDCLSSAVANDVDVVLVDTAGRLHNKAGLMRELKKIKDVMKRAVPSAPDEVLLVLDGSTGQNAMVQAREFAAVTDVSSLAVTKLDGTAKGGVVLSIADQLKVPVRWIGLGEGMEDLRVFDRDAFVDSLFSNREE